MKVRKVTKRQVEQLKNLLLTEQNKFIFNEMNQGDIIDSDESGKDEVDKANADVTSAQRLRFRNREIFYSKKIGQALQRIHEGEYGECIECGANIRYERLRARPTAELCIHCKEEAERDESSKFIARQSKSLGKSINLVASV
jgi:DnaK suppressor protein